MTLPNRCTFHVTGVSLCARIVGRVFALASRVHAQNLATCNPAHLCPVSAGGIERPAMPGSAKLFSYSNRVPCARNAQARRFRICSCMCSSYCHLSAGVLFINAYMGCSGIPMMRVQLLDISVSIESVDWCKKPSSRAASIRQQFAGATTVFSIGSPVMLL